MKFLLILFICRTSPDSSPVDILPLSGQELNLYKTKKNPFKAKYADWRINIVLALLKYKIVYNEFIINC